MRGVNFSWRLRKLVWKLEREKSKRREHGGKSSCGEIVRDFLTKLHSNYFRAVMVILSEASVLNKTQTISWLDKRFFNNLISDYTHALNNEIMRSLKRNNTSSQKWW